MHRVFDKVRSRARSTAGRQQRETPTTVAWLLQCCRFLKHTCCCCQGLLLLLLMLLLMMPPLLLVVVIVVVVDVVVRAQFPTLVVCCPVLSQATW